MLHTDDRSHAKFHIFIAAISGLCVWRPSVVQPSLLLIAYLPHPQLLMGQHHLQGTIISSSCCVHRFVLMLPGCKVLMFARLPSYDVFVVHAICPSTVICCLFLLLLLKICRSAKHLLLRIHNHCCILL